MTDGHQGEVPFKRDCNWKAKCCLLKLSYFIQVVASELVTAVIPDTLINNINNKTTTRQQQQLRLKMHLLKEEYDTKGK